MQDKLIVNLSQEEEIRATVPDINYIPAYKVAEEQRRANELERIANENERIEYYEEVRRDVENGEFNGKNTVYVGTETPTDDFYEVWIDPNGTPVVEAENIVMEDGETLQDKYENGELKGPKGDTPDLTDYATKEYVENEIATFDITKIVDELPETGLPNRFYFVPKADTQTQDLFDEYVWINGKWEWVTTKQLEVDLTPYYKKTETYSNTEIDTKINDVNTNIAGIVESGSNDNGSWTKWADGTMICMGSADVTGTTTTITGASKPMPMSEEQPSIPFPITFKGTPYVHMEACRYNGWIGPSWKPATTGTSKYVIYTSTPMSNFDITVQYFAIGKWK